MEADSQNDPGSDSESISSAENTGTGALDRLDSHEILNDRLKRIATSRKIIEDTTEAETGFLSQIESLKEVRQELTLEMD